jgi:hypothetical protein
MVYANWKTKAQSAWNTTCRTLTDMKNMQCNNSEKASTFQAQDDMPPAFFQHKIRS